jgi:hypothetical protein
MVHPGREALGLSFRRNHPEARRANLDNIPKTKKIIYARQHDFLCEIREAAGLIIWGKIRAMTQKRYRITGGACSGTELWAPP